MKKSKFMVRRVVDVVILLMAVVTVALTIMEDAVAALARKAREGISRTDAAEHGEKKS